MGGQRLDHVGTPQGTPQGFWMARRRYFSMSQGTSPPKEVQNNHKMASPKLISSISTTFVQGIGDSGQGFTNAILFIVFTRSARESFMHFIRCKCCRRSSESPDDLPVTSKESSLSTTFDQKSGGEATTYGSTDSHHSLLHQPTGANFDGKNVSYS